MTKDEIITPNEIEIDDENFKLKGKYISATGRRKTAIARIRLYKKGKGIFLVNNKKINEYFNQDKANLIKLPLKLTGLLRDIDFSVIVKGGGVNGQAEAIRHGISKALLSYDSELKITLKSKDYLTRDSRKKERKKPGLKKARRAPQWSKR